MSNNWRGRGRGSYNNNNNNNNNNYNNNNNNNSSILSRLGPTNANSNERNNNNNQPRGGGGGGGSRAFTSNNRGRGRGYKNTGGERFNNEFVDEDTDMKPDMSAGNVVTVTGYPVGAEEKVLGFISRKSKTAWQPLNVQNEKGSMYITVADSKTADDLCRMNNFTFGNSVLRISRGGDTNSGNSSNNSGGGRGARMSKNTGRSAYLSEFLTERWSADNGYLSLNELPETAHKIGVVMSRLLDEAKHSYGDSMTTVSFNGNKLWSVAPLQKLSELFPNLQNLSLADNDIAEFRSLDKLANRLPQLKELILTGNPIQTNTSFEQYKNEVLKRFPSIQFLDFQPVQNVPNVELPVPVLSNFFDNDNTRNLALGLLSKFFPLFDSNRASLIDLYDEQAVFTSVFSKGAYPQQSSWGTNQVPLAQRMVLGNENIIQRFQQLPRTAHDLSNAGNFMTDAWLPVNSTFIYLTVHGEFAESTGITYSFDRVFLLAQATTRAQNAGWNCVILSDSLVVRQFSCKPVSLVTA